MGYTRRQLASMRGRKETSSIRKSSRHMAHYQVGDVIYVNAWPAMVVDINNNMRLRYIEKGRQNEKLAKNSASNLTPVHIADKNTYAKAQEAQKEAIKILQKAKKEWGSEGGRGLQVSRKIIRFAPPADVAPRPARPVQPARVEPAPKDTRPNPIVIIKMEPAEQEEEGVAEQAIEQAVEQAAEQAVARSHVQIAVRDDFDDVEVDYDEVAMDDNVIVYEQGGVEGNEEANGAEDEVEDEEEDEELEVTEEEEGDDDPRHRVVSNKKEAYKIYYEQ